MSTARVIARNVFSNWANLLVSIVIGFFMLPFMVHRLGDSLYGIWTLVVSLVGYGALLDFGVRSSIVKYVSQYHAANDREQLRRLFATTLAVYAAIGLLVLALAAGMAAVLPRYFTIPEEIAGEARVVLLVVGFNLALKFPGGVFEGFVTGLQRYEIANAISIACNLLRTALTILVLLSGQTLLALAAVGLLADLLMMAAMAAACRRSLPWLTLDRSLVDSKLLRRLYSYGGWSAVIALAARALYESDSILIGLFLPAVAITHFAVANSLVRYLRQLAYGFGNVFNPAASSMEATSERERLGNLLTFGTRYAAAVVLPAAVLLALLGREFLSLWMGPRFAAESGTVLVILVLSQAFAMAQFPAGAILYGLNLHRWLALILMAEAVLKIWISVMLIPTQGIVGAAWGTAIPEVLASMLFMPLLVTRFTDVPLLRYLGQAFIPPLASVVPAGAIVLAATSAFPPVTWPILAAEVALGLLVYGGLASRLCIDHEQRRAIAAAVNRRIGR